MERIEQAFDKRGVDQPDSDYAQASAGVPTRHAESVRHTG